MTLIGRFWHALATWLTMSPLGSPRLSIPSEFPLLIRPTLMSKPFLVPLAASILRRETPRTPASHATTVL